MIQAPYPVLQFRVLPHIQDIDRPQRFNLPEGKTLVTLFLTTLSALRYLQFFPDILGDPLPHQGLIGDSLLRGDLLDRQEVERVELDRIFAQFSFSLSRENVPPERVIT